MSELLRLHMKKIAGVTDDEFEYIFSFFRRQDVPKKYYVLKIGQVCNYLNFCEKGCFRNYYVADDGEEVVVDFAIEDYWVGDIYSLINRVPTKYNQQALEDSIIYAVPFESFRTLCKEIPGLQEGYMMRAGRNNNAVVDLLAQSKHASAEERYLKMLERFPGLPNRVAANYIASYLGIQPASLSRLKKKFAAR
jgi:CRP-like cAMP-binding protein